MSRKTFTLFDPALLKPGVVESFKKLDPRAAMAQPGDVRRLRRQHHHHAAVRAGAAGQRRSAGALHPRRRAVAVVHGAVRQLRRGAGRRAQQGAGRVAARPEEGDLGQEAGGAAATARSGIRSSRSRCARATSCSCSAKRRDSRRRRGDRRRRLGRRERHHRRIGAGDPRVRRRLLRRDRRHARAVGLDRRARHGRTRARPSSTA